MTEAPPRQLLLRLREKYAALHTLRTQQPRGSDSELRPVLAALAREFPGVLRELDRLPLAVIATRQLAIDQVLASDAESAVWMRLQLGYHGFMRATLRIRRGLRARNHPLEDAARALSELAYQAALGEPPASRFDLVALHCILKPPAGRLNPWVFAQVAADHGVSAADVHAALFG